MLVEMTITKDSFQKGKKGKGGDKQRFNTYKGWLVSYTDVEMLSVVLHLAATRTMKK
jgi:hypothetical protein